jgi:polyhydroxybutyrate depolymerase
MRHVLAGLALACALTGCATGRALPPAGASPGTWRVAAGALKNGSPRSYLLHVPSGYRRDRSYPLVVVLHGAFATAREMEQRTGWSALADREGFVVAYPEGGWGVLGLLQHWNAGHCCGKAADENEDDVGFVALVVQDAARAVPVDPARVYLTGFSNGGMLVYRAIAERTELFAAAAPLAAAHGGRSSAAAPLWVTPEPRGPLPVLVMHGLADANVPFAGGVSPKKGGEREYLPAMDAVRFWVRADGLAPDPVVERLNGGVVTRSSWFGPGAAAPQVVLYTIAGWDHRWPGGTATAGLPATDPLAGFDATAIIWDFFSRHVR